MEHFYLFFPQMSGPTTNSYDTKTAGGILIFRLRLMHIKMEPNAPALAARVLCLYMQGR